MKRVSCFLLASVLLMSLWACGRVPAPDPTDSGVEQTTPQETTVPTAPDTEPTAADTQPTEPAPEPTIVVTEPTDPVTEPTDPAHSQWYIEGVSQDQMVQYFCEVVLNIEYTFGEGNASLVQKWMCPLYYRIQGEATEEDLEVLAGLFERLNEIEGFPGIQSTTDPLLQNLSISFLQKDVFNQSFGNVINHESADAAVQFWYYNANNAIYEGRIGYRTDISQQVRNSVLLEEVVNLLGISDTTLRSDSVVYQYGSDITELSQVDWVILQLLYHPKMQSGMDAAACEAVLRELYY